jgi:hypothetical protein
MENTHQHYALQCARAGDVIAHGNLMEWKAIVGEMRKICMHMMAASVHIQFT